jgi:hypothetical protein
LNKNHPLLLPVLSLTLLLTHCREETPLYLHSVAPEGDLADRVANPEFSPGDSVSVGGLVHDTGALTSLTSYAWDREGITREVYFLEPRRPELSGSLVLVVDAEVAETGVYGYGVRLTGGTVEPGPHPVPAVNTPEDYYGKLAELDLDELSAHPEHNGGFRPTRTDFHALTWRAVDWTESDEGLRWLFQSSRLPLPPFADPRLERWLQLFAETDAGGGTLRLWVGVRGSFLE